MIVSELFKRNPTAAELHKQHVERLRALNVEAGFTEGDAQRRAERDARLGLYKQAFVDEDTNR